MRNNGIIFRCFLCISNRLLWLYSKRFIFVFLNYDGFRSCPELFHEAVPLTFLFSFKLKICLSPLVHAYYLTFGHFELWLHCSSPHSLVQYRKQITSVQGFSLFFRRRAVGLKSKRSTKKPANKSQCVPLPPPKKKQKKPLITCYSEV